MKYVQPYGVSDPEAPYINGDPTIGRQGSIPPAAAFEHPMRELVGLISKSGQAPTDANLLQLTTGVRSQRLNYAIDTGAADLLTVAYDPPINAPYDRGLTLHVRVSYTNNGPCSINAGGGRVNIRKMNGADLIARELSAGAIITLIYDGDAFQLSNFGGGISGDVTYEGVNIPYANDTSTTPGLIQVTFPEITQPLVVGDIVAVKINQTNEGATRMDINISGSVSSYNLLPNGGGQMLQGDIAAGDVVQFFFDNTDLRFPPNPEINAEVTYTVADPTGPAGQQQFDSIAQAVDALRRKTIGANGLVILDMLQGVVPGPIIVSHPSGDRLIVRGRTAGAPVEFGDFDRTGNTPALRAADGANNIIMLRGRYLTEIRIPSGAGGGTGLLNDGPGMVRFQNLLVTGAELPMPPGQTYWTQNGVGNASGRALSLTNVTVWGAQVGFNNAGALYLTNCYASWCSHAGLHSAGASFWATDCAALGCGNYGIAATFASAWMLRCRAEVNGGLGVYCDNGGGVAFWWGNSTRNGDTDIRAYISSSITIFATALNVGWGTTSPVLNTVGNLNSMVAFNAVPMPP
jgi:hypothetical protein